MKNPTYKRTDPCIENVLGMLRPILIQEDLIGRTITATELAKLCRRHHKKLPFRSYRGLRLAEEIHFLSHGGGILIEDFSVQAVIKFDPETRRRKPIICFEREVPETTTTKEIENEV